MEEGHLDWFLGNDVVASRTGKWFLAIASTKKMLEEDEGDCTQLSVEQLSWDFNTPNYHLQIYIGGGYYFDENSDDWDGTGTGVINSTNTVTAIRTNHLSSFASGFLPEPNTIDFEFVFQARGYLHFQPLFYHHFYRHCRAFDDCRGLLALCGQWTHTRRQSQD